jgi:formate dehydrogenase subunit gamma
LTVHEVFSPERTRELVAEKIGLEGPLLPILHAVQEAFGHVPEAAIPVIAEELNLTRAEVYGVVTFYHDFRPAPAGRHVIKLCRAEACQSMGAEALIAHAERLLGVSLGETSADGRVTLEAVYCLGLCATSPAALVDGRPVGRLTPDTVDMLAAEVER